MAITTLAGPKGLYPDQTFLPREVVPEALIFQLATVAGEIKGDEPAIRVPYVKEDLDIGFVPEGNEIPVADPDLDEVLVRTGKLAHIAKQSNESSQHTDAAKLLADSLARAVVVKANNALLNNPVTTGEPTGLLHIPGIVDAGELDESLDAIVEAITAIEVNGGNATHITVDPKTWGKIRHLKQSSTSNVPLLGAPAEQVERRIFGLPVLVSAQLSPGTLLVSDQREIVAAVGRVGLSTSDHIYYTSDSLARRVTWRIGWNVVRPTRLAKITIPADPEPEDPEGSEV